MGAAGVGDSLPGLDALEEAKFVASPFAIAA